MALFASEHAIVTALRNAVFDSYQRLFPYEPEASYTTIVTIDDESLTALGQWPWPRAKMANLLNKIAAYKPAVIGFDMLFSEADLHSAGAFASLIPGLSQDFIEKAKKEHGGDRMFARAIKDSNVVLAMANLTDSTGIDIQRPKIAPILVQATRELPFKRFENVLLSIPELDQAAAGRGFITNDEEDGIVRRAPLFARIGKVGSDEAGIGLSLSMEMLRVATGKGVSIRDLDGSTIAVTLAGHTFPAQDDGFIWLRQSKQDGGRYVSAIDVIRGKVSRDQLENKIILIGKTGLGMLDIKTTVLRERINGVEIHAQMIDQLMAGEHLRRPAQAMAIELALMIFSGILLIWLVPKLRVHFALLVFLAIGISLAAIGLGSFHWGHLLIDVAWPAVSTASVLVVILAGSLAVSDQSRRVMGEQAARMGGELKAAQRIQMGLLPDPANVFAAEVRFTVAAKLEPARRVGGDFYDCFMLDKNRLFFVIADVSGKGLAAALFMASAKSHIKSAMLLNPQDVSTALTAAQIELARENPEQMFVTVFAAVLDGTSGKLDYVNAGHDAPFVRAPGQPVKRLQPAAGPPLCVMDDFAYPGETYQMAVGEWLFTMTDGVTEGTNKKGEFFGFDRLEAILNDTDPASSPAELVDLVLARAHTFAEGSEPADDITLLAMRWG